MWSGKSNVGVIDLRSGSMLCLHVAAIKLA